MEKRTIIRSLSLSLFSHLRVSLTPRRLTSRFSALRPAQSVRRSLRLLPKRAASREGTPSVQPHMKRGFRSQYEPWLLTDLSRR